MKPDKTLIGKVMLHNSKTQTYKAYATPSEIKILVEKYGALIEGYPSADLLKQKIREGESNPMWVYMKFPGGIPY